MKNRRCPQRSHCWGYRNESCDDCGIGNELDKLHKKIERLEKKNARLEQELAATPAIVRCKDCEHYHPRKSVEAGHICGMHSEGETYVEMNPDDFCSYGEKKEDTTP